MTVTISSISAESFSHELKTRLDRTGNTIEYAFELEGVEPTSWTAGSWGGSWIGPDIPVVGVTPTVGGTGSGADVELAEGAYIAWVRIFVSASEHPVDCVGPVQIT